MSAGIKDAQEGVEEEVRTVAREERAKAKMAVKVRARTVKPEEGVALVRAMPMSTSTVSAATAGSGAIREPSAGSFRRLGPRETEDTSDSLATSTSPFSRWFSPLLQHTLNFVLIEPLP